MLAYRQWIVFFCLISVVLMTGMGSAQEAPREPYISLNEGIALVYPSGWKIEENGGVIWLTNSTYSANDVINTAAGDLLSEEAVLVIFPPLLSMPMLQGETELSAPSDVVDFLLDHLDMLGSASTGAEITELGDVALNEHPASYVILREGQTEIFLMVLQMVDAGQNYTFLIGYTGLGGMARYWETFLEIAQTINFAFELDEVDTP